MFSDNNKVSGRQLGRMVFVEVTGTMAYFALGILSGYGGDGVLTLLWLYLFALVYTMVCFKLAAVVDGYKENKIYKAAKTIIIIILLAKYLCMIAQLLNGMADVVRLILIPSVSSFIIIAMTLTVIFYCINGGIESRGRACELLFFAVLIPAIILCATLLPKIKMTNVLPEFDTDLKKAGVDFLIMIWMFVPSEILIISKGAYKNDKIVRGNVYGGITLSAIVVILLFISAVGIYGNKTVATMDKPVLKLMQISGIPGGFLNRQDGIMSVFLIVSMFCAGWALVYYINILLKNLFLQGKRESQVFKFSFPVVVLVILAFFVFDGRYKEKFLAADIGGTELEERQFVMSVIVTEGQSGISFCYELAGNGGGNVDAGTGNQEPAKNEFELIEADSIDEADDLLRLKKGTMIDYSHMKALIIDTSIMTEGRIVQDIIMDVSQNNELAENIVMCTIELDDKIKESKEYGKTIEGIAKTQSMFKDSEVFQMNKMFIMGEGAVVVPLIDEEVNLIGSVEITPEID